MSRANVIATCLSYDGYLADGRHVEYVLELGCDVDTSYPGAPGEIDGVSVEQMVIRRRVTAGDAVEEAVASEDEFAAWYLTEEQPTSFRRREGWSLFEDVYDQCLLDDVVESAAEAHHDDLARHRDECALGRYR